MGDRANVRIKGQGSEVFLYTHSDGTNLPDVVRKSLKRGRERWSDSFYLSRIVFSDMVKGSLRDLTGYGISSVVGDGDYRVITLDTDTYLVTMTSGAQWTFDQFAALTRNPGWGE